MAMLTPIGNIIIIIINGRENKVTTAVIITRWLRCILTSLVTSRDLQRVLSRNLNVSSRCRALTFRAHPCSSVTRQCHITVWVNYQFFECRNFFEALRRYELSEPCVIDLLSWQYSYMQRRIYIYDGPVGPCPVQYECMAGVLALASFLFHFPLFIIAFQ